MSNIPSGYRPIPTPAEQVPMVPYDRLREGREVEFKGTRRISSKGEEYVIHEFTDKLTNAAFGLWGCALLDLQLAGIPRYTEMFLQYMGKEQRRGGRTAHTFTVAVSGNVAIRGTSEEVTENDDALPF